MRFTKAHGIGNDFVLIDLTQEQVVVSDLPSLSREICDRNFGVGADGVIVSYWESEGELGMRMWNPDGSESEMCGNGVRCFAHFVRSVGLTSDFEIPVMTGAGRLILQVLEDGQVRVDMGDGVLLGRGYDGAGADSVGVSMGNPHLVMFRDGIDELDLTVLGPEFERHPDFKDRTNVHFVEVLDRGHLKMRTWERGAGITLACGTGACACGVAAVDRGFCDRDLIASLPGGDLRIEVETGGKVWMTGPAVLVFDGDWPG